jgi:hypothetical protein
MSSKQRVKDIGEVFTPQHIVEQMVDLVPDWAVETTVLEPSVGEGVFLCEILRRKLHQNLTGLPDLLGLTTRALQSLYGVDIMLDNVRKTRENLLEIVTLQCGVYPDLLGLDPQSPENMEIIAQWRQILKQNIRWGDTLACFEAKSDILTGSMSDVICLKDLYREDVTDLKFFNYQKGKWEKYISSITEEIKQQRNEYKQKQQHIQQELFWFKP